MRNHSYENDFDLHENETACRTHFHMKGFALRLVMKRRHKKTRKWPILVDRLSMAMSIDTRDQIEILKYYVPVKSKLKHPPGHTPGL